MCVHVCVFMYICIHIHAYMHVYQYGPTGSVDREFVDIVGSGAKNDARDRNESDIWHNGIGTCTGPQPQNNSPPFQKRQYYTRGQVSCKNVLPTLGEKHKKK